MNTTFSLEQIEQMRSILAQHDGNNHVGIKEFDLNNPPKVPYTFQEYPRAVYHHAKRVSKNAQHEADLAAALAHGWTTEPFPAEEVEPELDEESAAEVAAAELKLAKLRKPKKAA